MFGLRLAERNKIEMWINNIDELLSRWNMFSYRGFIISIFHTSEVEFTVMIDETFGAFFVFRSSLVRPPWTQVAVVVVFFPCSSGNLSIFV